MSVWTTIKKGIEKVSETINKIDEWAEKIEKGEEKRVETEVIPKVEKVKRVLKIKTAKAIRVLIAGLIALKAKVIPIYNNYFLIYCFQSSLFVYNLIQSIRKYSLTSYNFVTSKF